MKVLTVVGARPQFVKAAAVSAAITAHPDVHEVMVHTGQHYDDAMSAVFFDELGIPAPAHNLAVGSAGHGEQTGVMMQRLEEVFDSEQPDCCVIYGDTNSTLAAALVAVKLHVPLAHVEAGLRSYDRSMPEEINRVVADHVSDHLYCPSGHARANLAAEGVVAGVHVVGDVMYDVLRAELAKLDDAAPVVDGHRLTRDGYVIATIHRPANTDSPERLRAIADALGGVAAAGTPVVWPAHPRTRPLVDALGLAAGVHLIPPAPYREMLGLVRDACCVVTDSGGLQKEAYWLRTPCVTVRDTTEWTETVEQGWNRLVDADRDAITAAVAASAPAAGEPDAYGDGASAVRIVELVAALAAGRR